MAKQEYPKLVYRADGNRLVNNAEEETAAAADGFGCHPSTAKPAPAPAPEPVAAPASKPKLESAKER